MPIYTTRDKWITIPVEVKPRDLIPHFLLGCFAVDAGMKVLIGMDNVIQNMIDQMPKGLMFEKSISPHKLGWLQKRINLGLPIVCSDAESFAFDRGDDVVLSRISLETIQLTTQYYTWGSAHTKRIERLFPAVSGCLHETGSPRFDQLRNEFRPIFSRKANEYRSRMGKYIIIMSNFAHAIHANGPYFVASQRRQMGNVKCESDIEDYTRHNRLLLFHFLTLIDAISRAFRDHKIILRPHPADDHYCWNRLLETYDNVHVIYEGSSVEWIAGAEAVIHNGCTTGTEAAGLQVPAITYMPVLNERYDWHPSNEMSWRVEGEEELLDVLSDITDGKTETCVEHAYRTLSKRIASIQGAFASEKIVEHMNAIDWEATVKPPHQPLPIENRMKPTKMVSANPNYQKQKFSGLSLEELDCLLKDIQQNAPQFNKLRVRQVAQMLFELY